MIYYYRYEKGVLCFVWNCVNIIDPRTKVFECVLCRYV